MKAILDYFVLPIDNAALTLRATEGRKEVLRAFVQAVFALLVLGLCVLAFRAVGSNVIEIGFDSIGITDTIGSIVDGIAFVIAAIVAIPLTIILISTLSILVVPFLIFFGILSIFQSRD